MEENGYPILEEENGVGKVCEPAAGYAATSIDYANGIMDEEDEFLDRIPVGKLGFYTDDPDVFEARMAEIEADLDEVESGFEDPDKWITSEQMHKDFLKMFPWLR
jgi:hypothetical protein